jgi:DNA mismatch repair protein MSH4
VSLVPRERAKKTTNNTGVGIEVTKRIARKGISALVGIKTTLSALPAFTKALEDRLVELESQQGGCPNSQSRRRWEDEAETMKSSLLLGLGGGPASETSKAQRHHLLRAIVLAMKNPLLMSVYEAVTATFTNSTTSSHRSAHAMRHEECFALRAEETSMIGVVRKAFLSNVDDIYVRADQYAEVYGFYVSVRYSVSRGYYLAVPEETNNLPSIFIHPSKNGRFIHCTTEEIASLNIRAQDNYQDLLFMTDAKIQEVLDVARSHYDALASLSDAIAILDMCHGKGALFLAKTGQKGDGANLTSSCLLYLMKVLRTAYL